MIRILVAAPTLAVRAGLRVLLEAALDGPALDVVDETARLADLESFLPAVDVLVVAAGALPVNGWDRLLAGHEGQVALLLLADDPALAPALAGLPLRAWGVLSLDCSAEELGAAVRAVHEGLLVGAAALVAPTFTRLLLAVEVEPEALLEALTERESQVLQLLARGLANKQIAVALDISEHTVKFHVSGIYAKLGATNRTEAARIGVQRGLVLL